MSHYTNIAFLQAKPDRSEALGDALRHLATQSRTEDGCLMFNVHESEARSGLWFVYEQWAERTDLDRHFETEHLQSFASRLPELLAEEMQLQGYWLRG